MSHIEPTEIQYLHRELLLRMWIQNLILILLMLVFPASVFLMATAGQNEELVALGYVVACGMGALYWIHNAARTEQIKLYLLKWEARRPAGAGWESWLKENRMPGILGSRWIISTKGVFVGSQVAMVGATALLKRQSDLDLLFLGLAFLGALITAILLRQPRMKS
jgi:hypothetical protein